MVSAEAAASTSSNLHSPLPECGVCAEGGRVSFTLKPSRVVSSGEAAVNVGPAARKAGLADRNLQRSLQVVLGEVKKICSARGMPHFSWKPKTMEFKNSRLISTCFSTEKKETALC